MLNINVLKGFEPRFRNNIPENCSGVTIPTVDNSSEECLEFYSTSCVKTAINYPYFSVAEGDTLNSVFTKIVNKVKIIADKFRTTIDYSKLVLYANDAAAGAAGLVSGMPYKDANGFVRVKI